MADTLLPISNLTRLANYPPTLYRYLLCSALSGKQDWIEECIELHLAGDLRDGICQLMEGIAN